MSGLEFKLDDWIVLKNIFINIHEIIDEVVVECVDDGLNFKGIDRSHICFFQGIISKELFDEYHLEEPMYLYLDLYELVKILKRGSNKDSLSFNANGEVIEIIFENENRRTFSLVQLDISNEMRDMPTLEYSITFNYDFDIIKNSLKDADLYSDRLTFDCENDVLILSCDGTNGNYENKGYLTDKVDVSCSSTYSISWLFKIFNNKISSDNLKIHMGNNYPMLIEMGLDNIKMNYLVAPRLENE